MAHYSQLYDIQTLAMLSCVFAGSKRRATSKLESSPRAERRRLVSTAVANAAADVAPSNVRCCFTYHSISGGVVAQSIEHHTYNQEIEGLTPGRALLCSYLGQVILTYMPLSSSSVIW